MKRLRYFFDPGSGVCLWAADDETRASFGYAVDHDALPLSALTRALLTELVTRFDESIDWNCPTERGPRWTPAVEQAFQDAADLGFRLIASELGSAGFDIVAEHDRSGRPDRVPAAADLPDPIGGTSTVASGRSD